MNIDIVGGTYFEECFEPHWSEIYGSGLRGCLTIIGLDKTININLHTFADEEVTNHLLYLESVFKQLKSIVVNINKSLSFKYDHPLADPLIYPRLDTIKQNNLFLEAENIVLYGTLDGSATIKGNKVVYDPQSPVNPIPFRQTKSTANKLIIIANLSEAKLYTGCETIPEIKNKIFELDEPEALIIKNGPRGAYVFTKENAHLNVPAYKTKNVWSIGSGDVFTSAFAYYWMVKDLSVQKATEKASYKTAQYCNSKELIFNENDLFEPINFLNKKNTTNLNLYLAGPFFTFSQRWLVQQFRAALIDMGINVFSPWHDVGFGLAKDVVPLDIEAIDKTNLMLSIVDGLDAGTLFEIGYARAKGIPVIAYVQNETLESLTMLEGTGCKIFDDLATAIYNAVWELTTHE